ncbi:hypothetical protein Tco_0597059 [Tanacetum coccineum]
MSTQQDIYAAGSENRPPMLNKENYVPWSSRLLRYAKSRPNGKLIYNSIMNGPYVRRMIPEPGDADREVPVPETFHEQTDDELTEAEIKQMEADDQAIQTILLGLPEDIYAAVDSCETAQEIWLRVQQMMKGITNQNPNGNGNVVAARAEKQFVAISSTEAEYVAAASCCAQVLWMQNQLLDYGFNFMNTEIHIDNESTIFIVKNSLSLEDQHIQIRHHSSAIV